MSEKDVKDASAGVLKDLKRFQKEKEDDFKRYMVFRPLSPPFLFPSTQSSSPLTPLLLQIAYAKCHIEWAKKNLETWEEARGEVNKIEVH